MLEFSPTFVTKLNTFTRKMVQKWLNRRLCEASATIEGLAREYDF